MTADNGNQSLERLKLARHSFDLLITDLQMPIMDGFESVRRFREYERTHLSLQAGYSPLLILGNNDNDNIPSHIDRYPHHILTLSCALIL